MSRVTRQKEATIPHRFGDEHLQRDDCPAHGGAADTELLGQVAFGGQALAWLILALGNGPLDCGGDLL